MAVFVKALALACAAFPLVSASDSPDIAWLNYPLVHQVTCLEGLGTAFRVGPHTMLSVAHVTSMHECTIDGFPIDATNYGKLDFATVEVLQPANHELKIDCGGFRKGEYYWTTGYAYGRPYQESVRVRDTGETAENGEEILSGQHTVIPGMSGGPVFNSVGAVVGTVNMYDPLDKLSLSRALKDTIVCGANIA